MSAESHTVLVLDHDTASQKLIVEALSDEGFEPIATDDGLEAIETCETHHIDIAVLDWDSAQLDALEVAYRVKAQQTFGPVVYLSKDVPPESMYGYVAAADAFLARPLDVAELRLHIRALSALKDSFDRVAAEALPDELVAVTDSLSGLYNRRFLSRRLYDEVRRCERRDAPISVLVIDLDDFKKVNTACGYRVGNQLLEQATQLLQSRLRSTDTVCRYGGDEYVAILPQVDGVSASLVAERVREEVQVHMFELATPKGPSVSDIEIQLTVSIGVADSREAGYNADTLLLVADESTGIAKLSGKNRVVLGGR